MEEKIGKTSVSRPGDLSEGEIDATVKAILEDTDVQDILSKLGITKGQVYQDLSNKKFILPKKGEDEVGYAKRYIKFQVVAILMDKYNEKIHDDTSEEARKQAERLAGQHATNLKRGDAAAIIAMIESQGYLLSRDGKTAKKLTQKQKDIIVRKLREGVNSIDELLEEMEFEDEEPEIEEGQPEQDIHKNIEGVSGEELDENSTVVPEFDDSEIDGNVDEINTNRIKETEQEIDENNPPGLEEVENGEIITPESKKYKKVEMEDNEFLEKNPEYRDATFYTAPINSTIEIIAADLVQIKDNNPDQKVIVIFYNYLIDPQKCPTEQEIIDNYNQQRADSEQAKTKRQHQMEPSTQNRKKEIDVALDNTTETTVLNSKGASTLQSDMEKVGKERHAIDIEQGIVQPGQEAPDKIEHIHDESMEEEHTL